jgi:hypothetical protein
MNRLRRDLNRDNRFGGICDLRPCALIDSLGYAAVRLGKLVKAFVLLSRTGKKYISANFGLS